MGKIRIIGGNYRRLRLDVLDAVDVRPTLDRVKETLFNWLGQDLTGLSCLDLFAGSGSLGFEALSRNAAQVIMVEKNHQVAAQLKANLKLFPAAPAQIYTGDALNYLRHCRQKFDVIFLDPPYNSSLVAQSLPLVLPLLAAEGVIYIEYSQLPDLAGLELVKQAKAGAVNYALFRQRQHPAGPGNLVH